MLDQITMWLSTLPINSALWILVITFIALDVILGTIKAIITKTLSSSKAREGVMHKIGFLGALLFCNLIDIAQSLTPIAEALGFNVPVSNLCAIMIITCEIISIYEHIKELNPNINLSFLNKDSN